MCTEAKEETVDGDDLFIGVDIGTESVRAGLFDSEGAMLRVGKANITLWNERGLFEQSSDEIWQSVCASVRQISDDLLEQAKEESRQPRICGIGFCATCSLVVVGPEGQPLPVSQSAAGSAVGPVRNVIVWMDHRAEEEAGTINASAHPVLRFTGGQISPEMQTPKLLWLKRRMPATFAQAAHFFDLADFATWRATGNAQRSICTLTCKWTYLAQKRHWDADYFRRIGLAELADEQFARIGASYEVCPIGSPIGHGLSEQAARELGLMAGIPVAASLIDAHAGALGSLWAGTEEQIERKMALILGTSACTMNLTREPRHVPGVWGPYFGAVWPQLWLTEGGISAFGFALLHCLQMHPEYAVLRAQLNTDDQQILFAHLERIAGPPTRCSTGFSADLHICPEFLGNRSPHADPAATAAFVGLRVSKGPEGLVQWFLAVLASLCYGIREILEQIEHHNGFPFSELIVSGGMAKNAILLQLLADITQKRVLVPLCEEPVLLGAAVLGAVAAGRFGSVRKASNGMVRKWTEEGRQIQPQKEATVRQFHERKFRAYQRLRQFQRDLREME